MRKLFIILLTLLCVTGVARGQDETVTGYDCECLIDGVSVKHGTLPPDGGQAKWQIDAASLPLGLHQVQTRIVQHLSSGISTTAIYDALCFRVSDGSSHQVTATCYIDGNLVKTATLPTNGVAQAWTLDLSDLTDGLHLVNVRITDKDRDGVVTTTSYDAMCYRTTSGNQHNVTATCYVDDQLMKTSTLTIDGSLQTFILDLSDLPEGLHQVRVNIADKNKKGVVTTAIYEATCYRSSNESHHEVTASCFVDGELKKKSTIQADGNANTWLLDLSDLPEGIHLVKVEIADKNKEGIVSTAIYEATCYRMADSEGHDVTATCYVDDEQIKSQKIEVDGSIHRWTLDLAELPVGLHRLKVSIADKNKEGVVTTSNYDAMFYRINTGETHDVTATCYVDEELFKTTTIQTNGVKQTWTLDMASLPKGLHHVRVCIADKNREGIATTAMFDAMCYRGVGRLVSYEYIINEDETSYGKVELNEPKEEFTLISLLPVPLQEIRSKKFHFEVNDDQPTIYAKNDIYVRFNTEDGSYTQVNGDFVDYRVKRLVEDPILIEHGETKTAPRPQENEILWYKVEALHGDSIGFKADRPCTIQVFSPNGEEMSSVSSDKSVQWNGAHANMDGTYYIAQHDMTATQGNTLSITYQHIDQYAILDYDVHKVGNGGVSSITFNGNGFDDLYALDLISHNGDTIHHVDLSHISNSTLTASFDFLDAPLGDYNGIFYFVEGNLRLDNLLSVEDVKDIELVVNVSYPGSYLVGNPVTYTVQITNKGNLTAYAVPIYTYIKGDVSYVKYDGLNLSPLIEIEDEYLDSLSVNDKVVLNLLNEKYGDDHHFFKFTDPSVGIVRSNYFFANIAPNQTLTLYLTITPSGNGVEVYFTIPEEWPTAILSLENNNYTKLKYNLKSRGLKEKYCCISEKLDCILSFAGYWLDMASVFSAVAGPQLASIINVSDCVVSVAGSVNKFSKMIACGEDYGGPDMGDQIGGAIKSAISAGLSCVAAKLSALGPKKLYQYLKESATYGDLGQLMSALVAYLDNIGTNPAGNGDCFSSFKEKIPGCPPEPPHGGPSTPRRSCEPNDMLGYTAPSGSHYIGNGLTNVYYTIQFENDSAATSPANVIILTDTIDARYFDLNTFAPTQVKIGDVTAQLSGEPNFVQTVDMRPRINCLAQVECNYNAQKGIAVFTLTSLDPMTLERVTDYNQGMLPPNGPDNMGQGEMSFNISLKTGLPEGTVIKNHADNIFDTEDPVFTPDWVNIIDGVKPTSRVIDCELLNDSVAAVSIRGEDDRSGPWRYDIYTQYGGGDWVKAASEVPIDRAAHVRVYEGIEHHFYAVLTDSAGNVETKQPIRELTFDYFSSDTESNLTLNLARGWNWMSHNLNAPLSIDCLKPNAHRILSHDGETINDPRYGYTGNVSQMSPTELYKVEMSASDNIPLSGLLFNSALKPIPLVQGWNWMGYPMPGAMSVNEALVLLEADENDCIVGQDGSAVYNDGLWRGTLTTLEPGKGYLLKVNNDKSLRFNASRSSVRLHAPALTGQNEELPWAVDIHRYPNVTPVIADLWDGNTLTSSLGYALAAFVDDECRGIATEVNGRWMMNVFGNGGETVTFKALDRNTGLVHDVTETQSFTADLLGTMAMPVQLHIADGAGLNTVTYDDVNVKPTMTTGPVTIEASVAIDDVEVINMAGMTIMGYSNIPSGFTLDLSSEPDGVYLVKVHTGNHISTVKVMKRSR